MESSYDIGAREVLACDESFFTALLAADHELLDAILADDFLIVDVLGGEIAHREELLGAISSGQLRFAEVTGHAEERSVRLRGPAAVVTGRIRMVMCYRGDEVAVQSRYTHVYADESGRWRLMSAQGTPAGAQPVSTGRLPLFCDTTLAGRIERVETQLTARSGKAARRRAGTAGFVIPIAGGVASFAGEGSPFNKVAGLGFGGVPDPAALDDIEKAFTACGSPVQIELAQLADPAIGALLTGRGYRLESFENVLGRALTGGPERVMPAGADVRLSRKEELETWLKVVAEGSAHRGRDPACAPPPGCAYRAAVGPARRRLRCWLRRCRHHHPARIEVPAERATPRLRPALCPCRPGQAALNPHACDLAGPPRPPATRVGRLAAGGHGPSPGRETAARRADRTATTTYTW